LKLADYGDVRAVVHPGAGGELEVLGDAAFFSTTMNS
jgi:hypothetical protein